MAEVGQRQPRQLDPTYLKRLRTQPCCLCDGIDVEAHHIRLASINDDKHSPGLGAKASDKWVVPLCNRHHRELHTQGEMQFWASLGINPFALCLQYQQDWGAL